MAGETRLPLDLGIYVNNRAAVFLDDYPLPRLVEMAVEVEELGFHSVWVGDSLLAKPRFAPIVTLAAIASRTRRVRLGTSILQPLFRSPILLAQEWATLDVLSGGRTILGVGLGAGGLGRLEHELASVGIDHATRGRRFDEYLAVLKRLWTEPTVSHDGAFYPLQEVATGYQPVQRPHPPLWVAAGAYIPKNPAFRRHGAVPESEVGTFRGPFDRVARLADGWLVAQPTPEEYGQTWRQIRQLATEQYGRPADAIEPALVIWVNVNADKSIARREARAMLEGYHRVGFDEETIDRYVLHGPAEACLERLAEYAEAGARTIVLVPASPDHPDQIRRVAKELLPHCARAADAASSTSRD
jgi:alkanesulfonate monooxygenase SsuD/methylene tetrahydromethanopterin reductase-like flavin-dependent oxidoreductase (luciferase family)